MPLEVHPITEADFPDFVRISVAAFQDGMASKLSPKPAPPEYIEQEVKKHIKCQGEEPDTVFLKVIDTDLDGKMIACCKWRINEKERTEEQIKVQIPVPGKDKEGNQAAIDFMNHLAESRLKWMGTKPFYCELLLVLML
jgi:hypothetical protein